MTTTAVTPTTTDKLAINDFVIWRGADRRQVVELADNGKPALFGNGSEWSVTLQDEAGRLYPMVAAASDRWNRV